MVSVILNGALGHMGRAVTSMIAEDKDMEIVAGIDARADDLLPFPVFTSPSACTVPADVIIDFSTATAIDELVSYGAERGIPMVICTTGLTDTQLASIKEASQHVAILRSANMSLGINVLLKLIKEAAATLGPAGFDTEIMEMHHNRKLDAPSGTALALADSVNSALSDSCSYVYDRTERHEKRNPKEIGIASLRGGTVVGVHNVIFAGQDEVIEFKHTAYSRDIFAKGAVSAAAFLAGKGPGMYDMSDVVG